MHVRLVADRCEAAQPEPEPAEQEAHLEREVARLRDQPDRAGRILVGRDAQVRGGVEDPDAVGAEHEGAGSPYAIAQRELARATRRVALAEPGGDDDERASTGLERRLHGVLERPLGHGHHDEVGLAVELAQRGAQGPAEQLATSWVDEVDRPPVGPLDRRLGEPVPPRLRVGRGSCDGDRARREERSEVAPLAHAPTRARSRAMISRWISDVPSQISSSFASRNHFSTGYSREYPNPPSVCTAAQVANIATSEA